jgi:hypothetical protein
MLESRYQAKIIKKIRTLLPGCVILKNDPSYIQGFPDIIVLYGERWGVLEIKPSESAPFQPNQEYYLEILNQMSYAACICPENEEVVLDELYSALKLGGTSRISECV